MKFSKVQKYFSILGLLMALAGSISLWITDKDTASITLLLGGIIIIQMQITYAQSDLIEKYKSDSESHESPTMPINRNKGL